MRIVVRAPNWLGDAVMSMPAVRAVRAASPEAHLAVVARPWVAELYRREPLADEVIEEPPRRLQAARELRAHAFDTAILFPNSFASALIVRLAGVPRRVGYARDRRGWLLTDAIAPPRKGETPPHESFYYLELLRQAGVMPELPAPAPISLTAAACCRAEGEKLFAAMGLAAPIIGVSPGAQNSRAKQWMPDRFVDAATRLAADLHGSVALFGSAAERPLCRGMAEEIRRRGFGVLNLAGETPLGRFMDLAAACRVFLTNDSGAMHLASALDVPTVAVFGPTDWIATAPSGPRARIVREPVECSPCMLRDCPIDHRCMTRVLPEAVARAALELVK